MKVENFIEILNADFYTGVPDSQLKALCDYLMENYGIDPHHHLIGANEGNCVALAAGYYLATGKVPVVYMQNSGEGNIINPVASLLNNQVYAIPMIFVVGWRGEPGTSDEPQHIYQGKVTLKLLEEMGIMTFVIGKETTDAEVQEAMRSFHRVLELGKNVAFVIRKGSLSYDKAISYCNKNKMKREDIIRHIVNVSGTDPVISTTGKASRELFEIRSADGQSHKYDFLTVGSMGHSSSIALGIALNKPNTKIWCIDGDGAVLMHMGSMAVIGSAKPNNMIHVIINNGAHETVGGMPTVAGNMDFVALANACGYPFAVSVAEFEQLDEALKAAKQSNALTLIEAKCAMGARSNLGRPTNTAADNKKDFMNYLESLQGTGQSSFS